MCNDHDKIDKLKEILTALIKTAEENGEEEKPKASPAGNNRFAQKPVDLGGKKHSKIIVFVARKYVAHELASQMWDEGFAADSLHGDRAQWERTKVINAFKQGTLRLLIATDVAARGLDVKDVGAVVNYDMPGGTGGAEDYIHRIGRTGRAGAKGIAHSFFTPGDKKLATELVEILTKAEQKVPEELQRMARPRFGGRGGGFGRGRGRGGGRGYSGGRGGRVRVCFASFLYAHHMFSFYNTRLFYIFLYLHVHRGVICLAEEVEEGGEVVGEAAVAATKEYYI